MTNLNVALEKEETARSKGDMNTVLSLQQAIKFNGGGHVNHSIFWKNLCPVKEFVPLSELDGELKEMLQSRFGSEEAFVKEFNAKAAGVQGSGWAVGFL